MERKVARIEIFTNLRLESSEASDPEDLSALELRRSCEFWRHLRVAAHSIVDRLRLFLRPLVEQTCRNHLVWNAVDHLKTEYWQ